MACLSYRPNRKQEAGDEAMLVEAQAQRTRYETDGYEESIKSFGDKTEACHHHQNGVLKAKSNISVGA